MSDFTPKIIAFVCNWCSYAGADAAGSKKLEYPAAIKPVRVMCSGRVDAQFVLEAFHSGADGVLVLGCHPGDCHYRDGNMKAMKRATLLKRMLPQFGVDGRRFRLDWVAAGEAERFADIAQDMSKTITELGPLGLRGAVESEAS